MIKEEKHSRSYIYHLCRSKPVKPNGDGGFVVKQPVKDSGDEASQQRLSIGDVIEHQGQKMVVLSMPRMMIEEAIGNPFMIKAGVIETKSIMTGSIPIKMLEAKVSSFDHGSGIAEVELIDIDQA